MKVSLVNHGTAGEWGGGDSVQIRETAKRLLQRGYEVDIQNSDRPDINKADIVHIFNCRVYDSFVKQIATCQAAGKPVVVSPIWINIGKALWGSRGTFAILEKALNNEEQCKRDLEELKHRRLMVSLSDGNLNADGRGTYNSNWIEHVGDLLRQVDGILPNSWLEMKAIQQDLRWKGDTFNVAHYGVDTKLFIDADATLFREKTGIKGDFIMQAGRVEAGKNQAMLCWALRKTNIPIVLIGSTKNWPAYARLCKEIAGDRLHIIEHMPQELLASAYAAARVHCLVSWMDTCGLVSLEAALNGTPIVGSTFGHELEYLKNDAWLADPGDPEDIKKAVLSAWETKDKKKQTKLKKRIISEYNWENTTDKTIELYEEII